MPSTNGHGSESETERVALYLRVSSEEQRERQTIQTQRELDFSHLRAKGIDTLLSPMPQKRSMIEVSTPFPP